MFRYAVGIPPASFGSPRLALSSRAQRGISLPTAMRQLCLRSLLLFFLPAGFAELLMLFPVGLFTARPAPLQKQFLAVQNDGLRSQNFRRVRHFRYLDCNSLPRQNTNTSSSLIPLSNATAYFCAEAASARLPPISADPTWSRFSISRITAEKSCSCPCADCAELISSAARVAGISAPTAAARLRISPKSLCIRRSGNCGL